jgi:hypothetical protein
VSESRAARQGRSCRFSFKSHWQRVIPRWRQINFARGNSATGHRHPRWPTGRRHEGQEGPRPRRRGPDAYTGGQSESSESILLFQARSSRAEGCAPAWLGCLQQPRLVSSKPRLGSSKPRLGSSKPRLSSSKPRLGSSKPTLVFGGAGARCDHQGTCMFVFVCIFEHIQTT